MEIDEKERLILLELYRAKGALRWTELKSRLVEAGEMSETTLFLKLKGLRDEGKGYVERRLINDQICWELTSKGAYAALKERMNRGALLPEEAKKELDAWSKSSGFTVEIKELHPEAWWNLVKLTAEGFGVARFLKSQTEEEFMTNLKSYTDQTKRVVTNLWPNMIHEISVSIASILASTLVLRAFLPSPVRTKDKKNLNELIDAVTEAFTKTWIATVKETVKLNFEYLEALVVLDKAIEEGKIAPSTRELPVNEVIKKLQELKLLKIDMKQPQKQLRTS